MIDLLDYIFGSLWTLKRSLDSVIEPTTQRALRQRRHGCQQSKQKTTLTLPTFDQDESPAVASLVSVISSRLLDLVESLWIVANEEFVISVTNNNMLERIRRRCLLGALVCLAVSMPMMLVEAQLDRFGELVYYQEEEEAESILKPQCVDSEPENCQLWAQQGECHNNPDYMNLHCRDSCQVCKGTDPHKTGADLGIPQQMDFPDDSRQADLMALIGKARNYVTTIVKAKFGEEIVDKCKNLHVECAHWAYAGQCDSNPACK